MLLWNQYLKNLKDIKIIKKKCSINDEKIIYENYLQLTPSYSVVILDYIKNFFMKKINKKYVEIMSQADKAVGRKEVVSLLKKAAMVISKSEKNLAA